MKIGIMGGTFNPIHIGHLTLGQWAMNELNLDEVWFIPTGISYQKEKLQVLPGEERLHMTELAIADNVAFKCLDMEVKREGYTYSYETMEQLKRQYPEDTFYFIVGADCLFAIENWKYPEKIFESCILAAAIRGKASLGEMEKKKTQLEARFNGKVVLFPFSKLEISSTEIRSRVHEGKSIEHMVPEKVKKYIEEKGFYRETKNNHNKRNLRFETIEKSHEKDSERQAF